MNINEPPFESCMIHALSVFLWSDLSRKTAVAVPKPLIKIVVDYVSPHFHQWPVNSLIYPKPLAGVTVFSYRPEASAAILQSWVTAVLCL